ncbi:DC-STAMP domain-containing protein 2-like isoform X1 [Tachypleus tridentatus]|uniref:DC-STAMP domain-containing protein 2-like isoform X1 n=1 Tax=Tachypleus tridentatus TaxID=6853 RepID=UPI003FD68FBF
MLKSLLGFIAGLIIVFLLQSFMVFQLGISPLFATAACIIMGLFFSLGLAFHIHMRCVLFLMLPELFSKQGRTALLAYIYLLLLSGPMNNAVQNIEVLSESIACGQERIANETRSLLQDITSPLSGVVKVLRNVIQALVDFGAQMRKAFIAIKDLFDEILGALRRIVVWIGELVRSCNEKMGKPYTKCTKAFDDAISSCKDALPSVLEFLCFIVNAISWICETAKIIKVLCVVPKAIAKRLTSQLVDRWAALSAHVKMHVDGSGVLADMYRNLLSSFDPLMEVTPVDTTVCLPKANHPNFANYSRIWTLFGICVLLVVFQAYGLRCRHLISESYYPEMKEKRAIWLYNHILRSRAGLVKYLRRQIRIKYKGDETAKKQKFLEALANSNPKLGRILKFFGVSRKYCLICAEPGLPEDTRNFKTCSTPRCKAIYCIDCFTDINNMCTACMNPVEYGDLSDVSEERDSSEEASREDSATQSDYEYQYGNRSSRGASDRSSNISEADRKELVSDSSPRRQ